MARPLFLVRKSLETTATCQVMVVGTISLFFFSDQKVLSYHVRAKWRGVPFVFIVIIIQRIDL